MELRSGLEQFGHRCILANLLSGKLSNPVFSDFGTYLLRLSKKCAVTKLWSVFTSQLLQIAP